ncbi:hypothetical protein QBC37DRAFT_377406 [Rhypophila decipiens]|uniref:Uncharacterized protein n=1 Tax=Rhypophila decipiens TaxID=261697 RepID=A0AAN6Y0B7_9PEZI|nr:hypothetical protein QBC37DRAFT_377406 [Rhypophila decipiens]
MAEAPIGCTNTRDAVTRLHNPQSTTIGARNSSSSAIPRASEAGVIHEQPLSLPRFPYTSQRRSDYDQWWVFRLVHKAAEYGQTLSSKESRPVKGFRQAVLDLLHPKTKRGPWPLGSHVPHGVTGTYKSGRWRDAMNDLFFWILISASNTFDGASNLFLALTSLRHLCPYIPSLTGHRSQFPSLQALNCVWYTAMGSSQPSLLPPC